MAAGTFTVYSANKDDINTNDITGATVKLALVSSAYTPSTGEAGHAVWADVSANEIANGNGYTTGGATLTTLADATVTNGFKLTSDNVVWTASGAGLPAHRYYVMYVSGALWGLTNPLIGYFVGDSTPADIPLTTSGNTLTAAMPAGGWFTVT